MKKAFIFYTCLVMLTSVSCFSQEFAGIKGIVKDSSTGEAIPYAIIRIAEQEIGCNASSSGFYMLKGIKPGFIKIVISAVGFTKKEKSLKLLSGDFVNIPILLSPEPVELIGVTSESERIKSTSLSNISVQSIDRNEMKTMPSTVEKDVMRTLKMLPGVSSTSDVSGQIYVRGGASDQNLIYCDNLRISNPFHSMGIFSIFSDNIVKSSDIISGGFDPQYGGKLSSVIRINTRDGNRKENKYRLNAGLLSGSLSAEGPLLWGSYLFNYRRSYNDEILKKFVGDGVSLEFNDLFGKFSADFGSEGNAAISFLLSGDDVDRNLVSDPGYKYRNFTCGFTLQTFINQLLLLWTSSYSNYFVEQNYMSSEYGNNSRSTFGTLSLNTKVEYKFTNNSSLYGGFDLDIFSINNNFTNSYGYNRKDGENVPELSLYINYDWKPIKELSLNIGARQSSSFMTVQSEHFLEPRVVIQLNSMKNFSLNFSYSKMHQFIISNVDEDEFLPLYEGWIALDKPLRSETSDQLVLGVSSFLMKYVKYSIQVYRKSISNYIGYNMNRTSKEESDFEIGKGSSEGLEFFFKYSNKGINGWITYNLSWNKKTCDDYTYAPRNDRRHSLSVAFSLPILFDINMGVNWDFSTGMPYTPICYFFDQPENPEFPYSEDDGNLSSSLHTKFGAKNSYRLPVYHKLDLSFSRYIRIFNHLRTEISLNITNLYDRANIFYYNRKTLRRVDMLPFMVTGSIGVEI